MEEEWRIIEGFTNYAVSNLGKVKRLKTNANAVAGRLATQRLDNDGYPTVFIRSDTQHKSMKIKVHVFVARAFIGERPPKYQINHKDGIKTNNRVDNLEYVTASENMKHAFRMGLAIPTRGELDGTSILKTEDVLKIRELLKLEKYTQVEIGKMFGVSNVAISDIKRGYRWGWLE